ncbi:MAG: hypothetical protein HW405_154 [Candidatus Berkelbacteria bacterium]|nr:hypothetical protein [Candidatus Berkelbacteria bacterium]
MDYISEHTSQIKTLGILLLILTLVYSSIRRSFVKPQENKEPEGSGPYPVPGWERILQIFLILGTAVYALWQFGLKRFILQETSEGSDLKSLIFAISMAVLFIFGYYGPGNFGSQKN